MDGITSIDAGKQVSHYWYDLGEEEEEEACSFALCLITDSVKLGVLKAVIDLGVLEIIKKCGPGGCLSSAVIAARLTTTNPAAAAKLGRLLDFLVSYSILTVVIHTLPGGAVERRYGVAPVCKFLTPNEDGVSLAPFTNEAMHKALVDSSLCLKDAVLEGVNPFTKVYGMTFYEYSGKHPEHQKGFHEAMTHHSTLILQKVLRTYKGFEGLSSLVDVGGGRGATLSMILSRYPTIKGINFDQPHVIADAPSYSGVEHKGGDMFVNIPKGDGIFLKWICHCFSDEDCIRILKNCYDALPEELGKVIICEYLLPDANETTPSNIVANSVVHLDMIMMALFGGKERTEKEFKALAMSSGFQGFQVVCSAYNVNIIELLK